MTEPVPIIASIGIQIGPWFRPDGNTFEGDLNVFAEQLTRYLAENVARFADSRGADVFMAVSVKRGEETAGQSYRDGHYAKVEPETGQEG